MSGHASHPDPAQMMIVRDHFAQASNDWGQRYNHQPRSMADLDLLLRRENVHRLLLPLLEDSRDILRVLDLGCGSGDVLDGIPRERVRVTGADYVSQMVSVAARQHPADTFLVADAARLPIATDSFDIITCLGVLEYLPDPAAALNTIAATMKPGGHLIISFPNKRSLFRQLLRAERGAERLYVTLRDSLLGRSQNVEAPAPYRHRQWGLDQARRLLQAAGLEIEEVMLNTYGPWGRLGRMGPAVSISAWLSQRLRSPGPIASHLACTMVIRAGKPKSAATKSVVVETQEVQKSASTKRRSKKKTSRRKTRAK